MRSKCIRRIYLTPAVKPRYGHSELEVIDEERDLIVCFGRAGHPAFFERERLSPPPPLLKKGRNVELYFEADPHITFKKQNKKLGKSTDRRPNS